ncbi:MAG TPA: PEP-CTERM sorting domain-containing protein [Fimbriiglobus sp.]
MRLNNTNSTAAFQVNGGVLRVDSVGGSGSGAITVNAGGAVAGTGTINGSVLVMAGGVVGSPGTGVGTLTVANSVTVTAAAPDTGAYFNLLVTRLGSNSAVGDQLAVTGGSSRLNFIGLAAGSPTPADNKFRIRLQSDPANPLAPGESYTITIAQTPGVQRNGTAVGPGYTFDPNDYQFFSPNFSAFSSTTLIVDGSNNLVMTFIPVPEPATVLVLAAFGLGAGGFLRRRFTAV